MASRFSDGQMEWLAKAAAENESESGVINEDSIRQSLAGLSPTDSTRVLRAMISEDQHRLSETQKHLKTLEATKTLCELESLGRIAIRNGIPICCDSIPVLSGALDGNSEDSFELEMRCSRCERLFRVFGTVLS